MNYCSKGKFRRGFSIESWQRMKSEFTTTNLNAKLGVRLTMHQLQQQNRIKLISSLWSIMTYCNLPKTSLENVTNINAIELSIKAHHQYTKRQYKVIFKHDKAYCKSHQGHFIGASIGFLTHLCIWQLLLFLTTSCSGRWLIACSSSISLLMKKSKIASIYGGVKNHKIF